MFASVHSLGISLSVDQLFMSIRLKNGRLFLYFIMSHDWTVRFNWSSEIGPYNYQKALYTGKHYIPESTYNYQKAMGKSISRADDARNRYP